MKQPGIAAAVDPFTVVTQGRVSVVAVRVQSSKRGERRAARADRRR